MCEAVNLFRQALAEQGLDANVTHETDDHSHKFYVSKNMAGDTVTVTTNVSTKHLGDTCSTEKRMAMAARAVSNRLDEFFTESITWDDRRVTLRPYNEPEATCETCGATVELPSRNRIFARNAELSAPQPTPVENKTVLESLNDHSRVLLKMYLIGKLREACEQYCPNSNTSTESFI